jgi:hypothetical protein
MAFLRFHVPAAIVMAAASYGAALALDAQSVPPLAVCAASLSLRLLPDAAVLEELRRLGRESSGNSSLPSFTEP